jgi:hypothetical protein
MSADARTEDRPAPPRRGSHLRVVPPSPKALEIMQGAEPEMEADVPPVPHWMRPVPRRSRFSNPVRNYCRQRARLRYWCDRVPLLKYIARVVV